MELPNSVRVLERHQISPPPASVPPTSLPLTFFDVLCLPLPQMQRLFFYEFPHPTLHFTQTILPNLKHSLSLSLQHFFPFAGTLISPPQPHKPYLFYTDGNSLSLTVAETNCDFNHLSANYPKDVKESHPLVPRLPPASVSDDGTCVSPLMVVQVTVFPNLGLCIGIAFSHVACDGRVLHHFMKSWASICRSRGDLTCLASTPPFYNRDVIKDPNDGILNVFLKSFRDQSVNFDQWINISPNHIAFADKVRITLVLRSADIKRLKHWISSKLEALDLSTFVVVSAFIWVCMIKSQETEINDNSVSNDEPYHFFFVADCSNRPKFSIPTTYFGNCLASCYAQVKRGELMGENAIFEAAKAIRAAIKDQLEGGVLKEPENWVSKSSDIFKGDHHISMAGSPRLRAYETDFGWGRPKKSEVVQIDVITGNISMNESRDEEGGVELGFALAKDKVDSFNIVFQQGLKSLMS